MHLVWGGTEVTVTDVWNVLSQRRQVSRNTVLTLMDRLEKKGWLKRRAEGQTHRYTAAAARAGRWAASSSGWWMPPSPARPKAWCWPCWKAAASRTQRPGEFVR